MEYCFPLYFSILSIVYILIYLSPFQSLKTKIFTLFLRRLRVAYLLCLKFRIKQISCNVRYFAFLQCISPRTNWGRGQKNCQVSLLRDTFYAIHVSFFRIFNPLCLKYMSILFINVILPNSQFCSPDTLQVCTLLVISRVVTKAYFLSKCVHFFYFGCDTYFLLSLFKFQHEK